VHPVGSVEQQQTSTAQEATVEDTQHQQLEDPQDTAEDTVVDQELQAQGSPGGNPPSPYTPYTHPIQYIRYKPLWELVANVSKDSRQDLV